MVEWWRRRRLESHQEPGLYRCRPCRFRFRSVPVPVPVPEPELVNRNRNQNREPEPEPDWPRRRCKCRDIPRDFCPSHKLTSNVVSCRDRLPQNNQPWWRHFEMSRPPQTVSFYWYSTRTGTMVFIGPPRLVARGSCGQHLRRALASPHPRLRLSPRSAPRENANVMSCRNICLKKINKCRCRVATFA